MKQTKEDTKGLLRSNQYESFSASKSDSLDSILTSLSNACLVDSKLWVVVTPPVDLINWNQGSSTKTIKIEDAFEKAMCFIDGVGFDWSNMAEEEIQANMAFMAFSDSDGSWKEFKEPEVNEYGPRDSSLKPTTDDEDEVESPVVVKKKTVIPTAAKIEKPVRKPVRYAEMYMSQRPRGNQRTICRQVGSLQVG
ncbi:hypothetical protein Tco_1549215 [Tanacetum coccineum]